MAVREIILPRVKTLADVQRAFDTLGDTLNNQGSPPFGALVEAALGTTEVQVKHGKGSKLRGWVVVDQDADARIWRSSVATSSHVPLTASATVNVVLWVF